MFGQGFPTLLAISIKSYVRNRQAMFFGFFFPLVFMGIFGLLNFGGPTKLDIGVADQARNTQSQAFAKALSSIKSVNLHTGTESSEKAALQGGHRDLVLVIPAEFGQYAVPAPSAGPPGAKCPTPAPQAKPATLTAYLNKANPQSAGTAEIIVDHVATGFSFQAARTQPAYMVATRSATASTRYCSKSMPPSKLLGVLR